MNSRPVRYANTDERYGNPELATLADYQELNPEGEFEARSDGLYENVGGRWQRIARPADDARTGDDDEDEPEPYPCPQCQGTGVLGPRWCPACYGSGHECP